MALRKIPEPLSPGMIRPRRAPRGEEEGFQGPQGTEGPAGAPVTLVPHRGDPPSGAEVKARGDFGDHPPEPSPHMGQVHRRRNAPRAMGHPQGRSVVFPLGLPLDKGGRKGPPMTHALRRGPLSHPPHRHHRHCHCHQPLSHHKIHFLSSFRLPCGGSKNMGERTTSFAPGPSTSIF